MGDADVQLARLETALDTLIGEVRALRDSTQTLSERMTRIEESTREAIGQVPTLRDRVIVLEREAAIMRIQLDDVRRASGTWGARLWELAKVVLTPALAAVGTWLLMR